MLATSGARFEQPQQVRDRRARAADGFGALLMRELEFVDESIERARLFQRVEILALDVLDERHRDGRFVRNVAHDRRNLVQARELRARQRRSPAMIS